jgi:rfaE bifunctional protein nucleotidyltransferase chain/domain
MESGGKIVDRGTLKSILEKERARGRCIVLANGCFDILHVGHVRYLEGAARLGDILVAAVNDDPAVRKLKGPGRPVTGSAERAVLVEAIECVDYVLVFPEDTVEPLLEELRPHVHCKGTDYTEETVPERETAAKLGIRVAITGDPKSHSSREIIKRLTDKS